MNNETTLPDPDEPLVLADGTRIDPKTGTPIEEETSDYVEVPTDREAVRTITNARKKIGDLPVPPEQMNILSVILMYTTMGLVDEDIATCTGLPVERVNAIRMTEAYAAVQSHVINAIVESDADDVRTSIKHASVAAVRRVKGLLNSKSEDIQLAAAKDILDRSGNRPADVVEHKHSVEGGLVIEYVDKKDERRIFDVEPITFKEG